MLHILQIVQELWRGLYNSQSIAWCFFPDCALSFIKVCYFSLLYQPCQVATGHQVCQCNMSNVVSVNMSNYADSLLTMSQYKFYEKKIVDSCVIISCMLLKSCFIGYNLVKSSFLYGERQRVHKSYCLFVCLQYCYQ